MSGAASNTPPGVFQCASSPPPAPPAAAARTRTDASAAVRVATTKKRRRRVRRASCVAKPASCAAMLRRCPPNQSNQFINHCNFRRCAVVDVVAAARRRRPHAAGGDDEVVAAPGPGPVSNRSDYSLCNHHHKDTRFRPHSRFFLVQAFVRSSFVAPAPTLQWQRKAHLRAARTRLAPTIDGSGAASTPPAGTAAGDLPKVPDLVRCAALLRLRRHLFVVHGAHILVC